jgi:hypothetical protein
MRFLLLVTFLLCLMIFKATGQDGSDGSECNENEIMRKGLSCQNHCGKIHKFCARNWVKTCFCDDGFIREEKGGRCILVEDCPK